MIRINEIRLRAQSGEEFAQVLLGFLYEHGLGVSCHASKARSWYELAANQGSSQGAYALALLLQRDEETRDKSLSWLTKAADSGFAPAQAELGIAYRYGTYSDADMTRALHWIELAANQGYVTAILYMAMIYEKGVGVDVDLDTSKSYLKKAADAGNSTGAFKLGEMLIQNGDPEDIAGGLQLIRQAAGKSCKYANFFLAQAYREGRYGIPRNRDLADLFFSLCESEESDSE